MGSYKNDFSAVVAFLEKKVHRELACGSSENSGLNKMTLKTTIFHPDGIRT